MLQKRRAILVLDNARNAAQVAQLLPPAGCAVLITSRDHLILPGLRSSHLDTLPPLEAVDLLLRIAPRTGDQADSIAKQCGYLPLALRLAGGFLAEHLDYPVAMYLQQLVSKRSAQLSEVEASLAISYELLNLPLQQAWRMLAVFPKSFDSSAAAAIWQASEEDAQAQLSDLVYASLVAWDEANKRYWLHDLLRELAATRLTSMKKEESQARRRHAAYYLRVLGAAEELYLQGGNLLFQGLTLFDREWCNIQAGHAWAASHAKRDKEAAHLCCIYPTTSVNCSRLRLHPNDEWIPWLEAGLAAARRRWDFNFEVVHLSNLGNAYQALGKFRHAIEYHERSLAILRVLGDSRGKSVAFTNIGLAYFALGEYHRAIMYHEKALTNNQSLGDQRLEGSALCNLGVAHFALGECHQAIDYHVKSLAIARSLKDICMEGHALNNLGNVYKSLGEYHRAIKYYKKSLTIAHAIGDRQMNASVLGNLGIVYAALCEYSNAIDYYEQSLAIAREINDRWHEGNAIGNLGDTYLALGKFSRAIDYCEQHLIITREIGDPQGEGNALGNLGSAYFSLGDYCRAIEYHEQHLTIAQEIGDKHGEGEAQWHLSQALDAQGEQQQAIIHAETALEIFTQIQDPDAARVRLQLKKWKEQHKQLDPS